MIRSTTQPLSTADAHQSILGAAKLGAVTKLAVGVPMAAMGVAYLVIGVLSVGANAEASVMDLLGFVHMQVYLRWSLLTVGSLLILSGVSVFRGGDLDSINRALQYDGWALRIGVMSVSTYVMSSFPLMVLNLAVTELL